MPGRTDLPALLLRCFSLLFCGVAGMLPASIIPAKHKQGSVHGFLMVRSEDGKLIGLADQVSVTSGATVLSRLTIHFRDGSVDDETTVFTQGRNLKVLSDHHVQKGPSYPKPMDLSIDSMKHMITWHEWKDGKEEVKTETMDIPEDLANGIIPLVIENFPKGQLETKVSYVTGTPKPRIVKLAIKPEGRERYRVAGNSRQSIRYVVHIELGGITGVIAPVIGKQPTDIRVWVTEDEVRNFLRMQGALYQGGPIWTSELTSPVWTFARETGDTTAR